MTGALEDVNALPEGAYERTVVREVLKNMLDSEGKLRQRANKEGAMDEMDGLTDTYDQEEMAAIFDFLKSWKDEVPVKLAEERRLGWQEGQKDGLKKGRMDGLKKGRMEGRKEALQGTLRTAFKARFGAPPRSLLPFFERSRSEAASNALVTLIVTRPLEEVVAALRKEEG